MFDIGFTELIVCAVVALVVIGPERMPEAVRTIGLWIGRVKRSLRETRSEIERQIGVDDIRRQLHNEDIMQTLEAARRDMEKVISETQHSIESIQQDYKSEPDLPYHSHTDQKPAEHVQELPAAPATDNAPELANEPAKITALTDNKLADNKLTDSNQVSLDKKASL